MTAIRRSRSGLTRIRRRRIRLPLTAAILLLATALPARAALVLEYIEVASITAPPSAGPALTGLSMNEGGVTFLQVALRDTTGDAFAWNPTYNLGVGLGGFLVQFNGIPAVAVNPSPTAAANARLVDPVGFGTVSTGTLPPTYTRIGGLLNFGYEPGPVPDAANQNRIPLFNLRIVALGVGSGTFRLRDPNPAPSSASDNLILAYYVPCPPPHCDHGPQGIDDVLFGPTFTNTFDLPVVVTPEPSALALTALAVIGCLARRRLIRASVAA